MEYSGDGWLGYDQRICQRAAANLDAVWARKLTQPCGTLPLQGRAEQVNAASASACLTSLMTATGPHHPPRILPRKLQVENCFMRLPALVEQVAQGVLYATNGTSILTWHPGCKYRHIFFYCTNDARVADKEHKVVHCSQHRCPQPWQINTGPTRPTNYGNRYQPY